MRRSIPVVANLATALVFSGCATAQAPVSGKTVGAPGTTSSPIETSSGFAADVVAAVNAERARVGLGPLAVNARLMKAARIQAEQMVKFRLIEHTIPRAPHPDMKSRFKAVGYAYSVAAENLAWNQANPKAAVSAWMASKRHRANILDPRLTQTGVAMVRNARGEPYWVQVFGTPR